MILLFWICATFIVWHYIGYPCVLFALCRIVKPGQTPMPDSWPSVSIIIPAYNEQERIARRIENCLSLDYPGDRLEIIVGSDGSSDKTVEIAKQFEPRGVKVLDFPVNRGRSQVHNDCVNASSGDVLCFTDSDTLYKSNCIKMMVRHYSDPEVGCVGGALQSDSFQTGGLGKGQGLYWKWEYALRKCHSVLGILTKTSGANMSMRKELYHELPDDIDIDQAAGPIVILQGYRVIHEHQAIAYDEFPTSIEGEFSTRRRFAIQALTALWRYRQLLNPFKHPWLAFNLFSYRLLRYMTPFMLCTLFLSNIFLLGECRLYDFSFALQCLFYFFAFLGFLLEKKNAGRRLFSFPFAFVWANLGMLCGGIEFMAGRRIRTYRPVA